MKMGDLPPQRVYPLTLNCLIIKCSDINTMSMFHGFYIENSVQGCVLPIYALSQNKS